MASLFDSRRYLTDFDANRTGNVLTDVLVVGAGVAGARAALEAARFGQVIVLTKAGFEECATSYAQGGIAGALSKEDSPGRHFEDTMRVGCGLGFASAVKRLVEDGPARIQELMEWGLAADRVKGAPALGREGGHGVNRILHAKGDQTGRELVRVLKDRVLGDPNIRVFERCHLIDLLTVDGRCAGAVTFHPRYGHQLIWAKRTILASGGCGQLWRETTNPAVCTGDGLAAAFRAGAVLRDAEFVQFHPTTLYVAGAARKLISEAVRGEGAYLVDRTGHRFTVDFHPDAELAPRDVVSRAIHERLSTTRSNCVYLDVRHLPHFTKRFPYIAGLCADFGIDVTQSLIPVRPSAHYFVGGLLVDLDGRSTIENLLCCGEAASTGVHGANRLASNSLLEGLVFGRLAGEAAGREASGERGQPTVLDVHNRNRPSDRTELDLLDIISSLRSVMWRNVGVVRTGERLHETCEILDFWSRFTLDKTFDGPAGWVAQNELTLARQIAAAALARKDSIGVHYRSDFPNLPDRPYHVEVRRTEGDTALRLVDAPRMQPTAFA